MAEIIFNDLWKVHRGVDRQFDHLLKHMLGTHRQYLDCDPRNGGPPSDKTLFGSRRRRSEPSSILLFENHEPNAAALQIMKGRREPGVDAAP